LRVIKKKKKKKVNATFLREKNVFQNLATKITTLFGLATDINAFSNHFRCKILKEQYVAPDESVRARACSLWRKDVRAFISL